VCLDGLDRDEEFLGDFFVLVAASDEPHYLTLARTKPVELFVDHRNLTGSGAKGIQDEACQPGAEHGVATGDPANGGCQVLAVDGLGDVSASASPDDRDHVL